MCICQGRSSPERHLVLTHRSRYKILFTAFYFYSLLFLPPFIILFFFLSFFFFLGGGGWEVGEYARFCFSKAKIGAQPHLRQSLSLALSMSPFAMEWTMLLTCFGGNIGQMLHLIWVKMPDDFSCHSSYNPIGFSFVIQSYQMLWIRKKNWLSIIWGANPWTPASVS